MGLLGSLLLGPFTAPVRGFRAVLKTIRDEANAEFFDETGLQQQLVKLNMKLELGEISEDEFREREASLLERLKAIRRAKAEAAADAEGGGS